MWCCCSHHSVYRWGEENKERTRCSWAFHLLLCLSARMCAHMYAAQRLYFFMFNVNESENCIFVLQNFPFQYFLHVTAFFLFYKISALMSERRLTRCPLQSLPWCSGFGVGWRCSSVPALSAGRVCDNPPWRQSVKFHHNRKMDPT